MRLLILALVLAFAGSLPANPLPSVPTIGTAAITVTGRIVDADAGLPLEFATVTAFTPDSTLVTGASTDSLGNFELSLGKGEYRLRFEFIGYEAQDSTLSLKQSTSLGIITLRSDAVALEGATVTAQRSQLSLKLDRQVFDVGADILSRGGSANEVLENVPSIDVSPEGVVSLRGNAGVKILIDGKPSVLADNNALASIPADNIASVEIMTAPSARYEAAGTGGIINIILKNKNNRSVGGQISASVGLPTEYRVNASISATRDKWTLFGNGGARYSEYYSTGNANRRSELASGVEFLREDLVQDRSDKSFNGFGGFDYRPTDKTTLSASYSHYYQLDNDVSNTSYVYRDGDRERTRQLDQRLEFRQPGRYNQIEVSWAQELQGKDRKLFVLLQNDFWREPEFEDNSFSESFPVGKAPFQLVTSSDESSNDYLLQVDYEQPFGKTGKLEGGVRGETRIIASDYLAETIVDGTASVFQGFDNKVDYFERIAAAYIQYSAELGKWGLQVGLRDEYTYVRVEQRNGEADITKKYNRLFPSATLSRQLNDKLSANFSYTSRIRRPWFGAINPFGGVSNPNEIQLGNADIDPSFVDAVELKVLFKSEKLTINPFVSLSYVNGFFDRYATQDSSGLVQLLWINLDQERQVAGGITLTYFPVKDWQITGEGYLGRFTQRGTYLEVDFANAFTMSSLQLGVRGKLFAGIQAQATYDYWGGQRYAQFYQDPNHAIRAGLSRDFLDDRLQLSLNVRNLFELQEFRGGSQRASFTNEYTRVWQQERWLLTATWDIGKDVRMRRARGSIR